MESRLEHRMSRRHGQMRDIAPVTLGKWLISERSTDPIKTPKFIMIMSALETAIRSISQLAARARINRIDQRVDDETSFPITKQETLAHDIVLRCLKASGLVSIAISTVSPTPILIDDEARELESYVVCYNPLDGANHLSASAITGMIFSIYKKGESRDLNDIKCGNEMIAGGFAVFATCNILMLSIGKKGVQEFLFDPVLGEFIAKNLNVTIPVKGHFYCIDEAKSNLWNQATFEYINRKKNPKLGKVKKLRFVGSLCADTYRTLKEGGILLYPETSLRPLGQVRLLCEGNALSYLVRVAGGLASTGRISPLDVLPRPIHRTCPLYLGSREDVIELLEIFTIRKATS
ncbi:fructose-1,6-bisphosphatase 1-like [Cimex lectularius]|uniref:fructose-bisphosphatase n=1 Tax=Cimex lectularius TaxID=79782 RepID=A0A8I6TI77_CIMLE|nr:fructose-1,6-bisphosphatase 1-like [Cimex lectularius]